MKKDNFVANTLVTLGTTTHSRTGEREEKDFYATEPKAVELLLELEEFNHHILEPCAGQGHISNVLINKGFKVTSTDLIDRGYTYDDIIDFFAIEEFEGDIITNPPYGIAKEFVEHALKIVPNGNKVAMFVKTLFLESAKRKKLFLEHPPKTIWVSSSRLQSAKNGDFSKYKSSAVSYSWFVWEKGYKGDTVVKWFN